MARFVCMELGARDPALAERAAAEAFAAGASGSEEVDTEDGVTVLLYVDEVKQEAVRRALQPLVAVGLRLGPSRDVPEVDWSQEWRAGLAAIVISPRLAVTPSGVEFEPTPGQALLVVEPGQAFGTGSHASTRLALEGIDALAADALRGARVLDVGSGSGVLALAALRLGARAVVAFDCDPLAARATLDNARANGLDAGLRVFCGTPAALAGAPFDGLVANLLRTEVLPLLPALAAALRPGGFALLSGLLVAERAELESALAAAGLAVARVFTRDDPTGDAWLALLTRRAGAPASRRAGVPASVRAGSAAPSR